MNSNILLTIVSVFLLIMFRLGKGDLLFLIRPEIYLVAAIGALFYNLGNKFNFRKCLVLQFVLTLTIPLFFTILRGY
tara:strand:+ start:400 stop:630 length:231 start_codon:yes stop_codon:yes gene_type:complete